MTIVCPLQYFGLGDIIFTQTLIKEICAKEDRILWGVYRDFVEGLNRAYPEVMFVPYDTIKIDYEKKEDQISNWVRTVPIRWSDSILGVTYNDHMKSKYMLYNLDFKEWTKHAKYIRNREREEKLLDLVVGRNIGFRPYNLVNETFNTTLDGHRQIKLNNSLANIYLTKINGYSLFDWSLIIEQAVEVHTVSTSLFYLLELLELDQPLHLYARPNDPGFDHISYLFTKPYILHSS